MSRSVIISVENRKMWLFQSTFICCNKKHLMKLLSTKLNVDNAKLKKCNFFKTWTENLSGFVGFFLAFVVAEVYPLIVTMTLTIEKKFEG